MILKDELKNAILKLQKVYPEKRSAIIPALHLAQTQEGYLPLEMQQQVADLFDVALNEVQSLVTFYDMFHEKPMGKHLIHVCKNVSCMLRGSDDIVSKLCSKLNVKPRETTSDGEFTIIPSECLGACDRAPMMLVDDRVIGPLQESDLDQILMRAKAGHGHPTPITIDEVNNG